MTDSSIQRWRVTVPDDAGAVTDVVHEPAGGRVVLLLAHGAGGDMDHPTLEHLAQAVRAAGIDTVRFNFLYRQAGRGGPDRMPRLQACYRAVSASVRQRLAPPVLLAGGHSMGGRCASMLAAGEAPPSWAGLVLSSYPLHPEGRPERMRADHLPRIRVPVLCLNGTRDRLCDPQRMQGVVADLGANFTQHWLTGADHGYGVLKRSGRNPQDVFAEITETVRAWLARVLSTPP